jgi:phenylalanyl-tRNA synthetase beta chain
MTGEHASLKMSSVRRLLDPELKPDACVHALKKLRYDSAYDKKSDALIVEVPAYRSDILHPADIVEDVAIGIGYDSFAPILPKTGVLASRSSASIASQAAVASLVGLGFTEIVTLILTDKDTAASKVKEKIEQVPLLNPFTVEHTHLRSSLLPSALQVISLNRRRDMPIKVFEVGRCVLQSKKRPNEELHLCGAMMHPKAGFTECKSVVEAVLRDLGLKMALKERDHPTFIPGRCASVIIDESEAGLFGEVHPDVLVAFELPAPVAAFEIDMQALSK